MTTDDAGSAPEADADSTRFSSGPTEPAPAESAPPATGRRRGSQARATWRRWRRSRPFWGGLLLVLSGLELLALPLTGVLVKGQVKLVIYIGIGGVFGVLIGILLIAAGIVLWVNPTHRVFYGIAGIVLGIISFPASNLGGFVLGMLLAIIGGALAFAWVPAEPDSVDAAPAGRATARRPTGPATTRRPTGTARAGNRRPASAWSPSRARNGKAPPRSRRRPPRDRMAAAFASATRPGGTGRWPSPRCRPCWWPGCSAPAERPRRRPRSPTVTASSASSACRRRRRPRRPPPPRRPRRRPRRLRRRSPPARLRRPRPVSPGPAPRRRRRRPRRRRSASPSPSGTSTTGAAAKGKKAVEKHAAAPSGITASAAGSVLTAGSVTLTDFQYLGNVNVPVSGGATEEMMEFTRQLGRPVGRRHRVGHPGRADHGHQQPVARVQRRHDALRDQALRQPVRRPPDLLHPVDGERGPAVDREHADRRRARSR